jgi:hypothetical protein
MARIGDKKPGEVFFPETEPMELPHIPLPEPVPEMVPEPEEQPVPEPVEEPVG